MVRSDGETRNRILGVAMRLFCERGYDATGVKDIVGAAAVSPPALYYHFGSKAAILTALVEPLADAVDHVVTTAGPLGGEAASPRAVLGEYLDALIRWQPVVCFLADDPAVRHHPDVGGRLRRQQRVLQSLLAGGDEEGSARSVAAAAALGALWRPVTCFEADELRANRQVIVDAAVAALQTAHG